MTSRYYKRELFNRADENQTKRKKPPKHVSPITVQLQDNDSAAITNVTNLDKQTFASVAKFRGETLREVKTLQRSAAPTVSSEEASAITGSDNHLSTIPAHEAATQTFRCQFPAVPTAIAQSEQRNSDSLWAGQFGDRIPVGATFFRTRPDRPWAHPASCTMDTESFSRGKAAGVWS
jgi:hypothetical protein